MLVRIEPDVPDGCSLVHGFWGCNRLPDDRGGCGMDFGLVDPMASTISCPVGGTGIRGRLKIDSHMGCGFDSRAGHFLSPFLIKDGSRSSRRLRFA